MYVIELWDQPWIQLEEMKAGTLQVTEDTENQASWEEFFVAFFLKGINPISIKDKHWWELDHTKHISE